MKARSDIAGKINILPDTLQDNPGGRFNACIEEAGLADLVQFACMEGQDRVIEIQGNETGGKIFFSKGEVVHSICQGAAGEDAFFRLMGIKNGNFLLKRTTNNTEKTIQVPWNFLLIEALRRKDEAGFRNISKETETSILVIDNSHAICATLEGILRNGCGVKNVITANDGKDALEKLITNRPSLIALDINMSIMCGDLAVKHIMIRSPAPVFLFFSKPDAQTLFPKVMELLRLGAMDFIPKPENDNDWAEVSGRMKRISAYLSALKINNIRRARQPKEFSKKARQTGPASKLFMVIGGIGGLIELQKILPSLPSRDDLAVLVFQDMADGSVPMFSSAMDQCTEITISQLKDGGPILSSHCWFVNWTGSWKIACWENGQAIRQTGASSVEKGHFDIGGLISAASLAYGPNLAILALSGTDLDMKAGLEDAVMHGSHFWLQNQASALYPGPLEEIGSWELEEATVETEAVGKLLQRWCQGETLWQDF